MDVLPIIDVAPLVSDAPGMARVAQQIDAACRDTGFFYVVGHGVERGLATALESASRSFFALDTAEKIRIRMDLGGRAWRGYFPVGGELTSGIPDDKEGLYFGAELDERDPRVIAARWGRRRNTDAWTASVSRLVPSRGPAPSHREAEAPRGHPRPARRFCATDVFG